MFRPHILSDIPSYSWATFRADLFAGITVAMVALPLSLAIAIASGANPAQGLVTAIVAGGIISLLGGSAVQIGGPTGAFIVVVAGVIHTHGYDGLVLATLMAGVILWIAGLLRAGQLIGYVPEPVVDGFTIGIGVIIGVSQIKDFLGLDISETPPEFIGKLQVLLGAMNGISLPALLIGSITMVLIIVFRKLAPRWPGLIVALALTSAMVAALSLPVDTIASRFGDLPRTLPMPKLPVITLVKVAEMFPSAMVIAFLAGIESLLSAVVADRMRGSRHKPNAEVLAQGTANIASAMFGGLPATGAIARTATNIRAGGKTPVAGIVHALGIAVMMLAAAPLAGQLAMPAMAALLILTAWNMTEPHKWPGYLTARASDKLLLLMTLLLTLLVDLTVAIGAGVALGLALRLRRRGIAPTEFNTNRQ